MQKYKKERAIFYEESRCLQNRNEANFLALIKIIDKKIDKLSKKIRYGKWGLRGIRNKQRFEELQKFYCERIYFYDELKKLKIINQQDTQKDYFAL